jgi:SSS family solute:Na+ symporter
VVSLATPAPSPEQIKGLTYSSLTEEQKQANRNSYNMWDIVLSLIVIGIVAFIMISFTG